MNNADDRFIHELRDAPSQAFADTLRKRLRQKDHINVRRHQPMLRAASIAAVFLSVAALLAIPNMRAVAQQFLELFRVKSFVAVEIPVDQDRLSRLTRGVDFPSLIGNQVTQLSAPVTARLFPTVNEAAQAAGFSILVADPNRTDMTLSEIKLYGAETWQVTPNTEQLQQLLNILEIHDLTIPRELDGQTLTWTKPVHVQLSYQTPSNKIMVLQAPIPQIELPGHVDLAMFGEIGLRIYGMSPSEAHNFAQAIDWRTTFVIPLPQNAASFQRINVQGHNGLLIESRKEARPTSANVIMWSDDNDIHVVGSNMDAGNLLAIASSMQPASTQ